MKCIITEEKFIKIMEYVNSKKIVCDECRWSWKLSEGGDDPFICHNCGHNNEE